MIIILDNVEASSSIYHTFPDIEETAPFIPTLKKFPDTEETACIPTNIKETLSNMNGNIFPVEQFSSVLRGLAPEKLQNQSSSTTDISGEPDNHFIKIEKKLKEMLQPNQSSPIIEQPSIQASTPQLEEIQEKPKQYKSKLLIIFLAIAIRLSFVLNITHIFGDSVFLPFILLEIYKLIFMEVGRESMGMIGATLMLCGISQNLTNSLFKTLTIVKELIVDYSLFLFSFILTHILVDSFQKYVRY